MYRIFVLEDDENILFGIKRYLEQFDFEIISARSVEESKSVFNFEVDIILLDINLGDGTGYDFLNIFKPTREIPIIFLTVRDDDLDIIKGLEFGADDYITKPFKLPILKTKIDTILRRVGKLNNYKSIFKYEGLVLSIHNNSVHIDGERIELAIKEYKLLEILMQNEGRTLTREIIMERIWDIDGNFVTDNTLSATVKRLREKLGEYKNTITTVKGIGYKFN